MSIPCKSPLRYPGGKQRAVDTILALVPEGTKTAASPFMGGGSIEIAMARSGIKVSAYDAYQPLVFFWQAVLQDPVALATEVRKWHPMSKEQFYALQKRSRDNFLTYEQKAAHFFVLNRASFSGTTLSGGMSPGHPRFTPSAIKRLEDFTVEGLTVKCRDFRDSIPAHGDDFLYLDPPYANGEGLYGDRGSTHKGFKHDQLAALLVKRERWILSYNDCPLVRALYQGFGFASVSWKYGMGNDKSSNEVLIFSKDLAD